MVGGGIQLGDSGRLVSFDDLEEKSVDDEINAELDLINAEAPPVQLKVKLNKKPGYNPRCRRSLCSSHSSTSLSSVSRETSLSPITTTNSASLSRHNNELKLLKKRAESPGSPVYSSKVYSLPKSEPAFEHPKSVSTHTQFTPPRYSSIPIVIATSPKLPKRPNKLQVHTQTVKPKLAERSSSTEHRVRPETTEKSSSTDKLRTTEKACSPIKQPSPPKPNTVYVVPTVVKPKTSNKSSETSFDRKIRTKINKPATTNFNKIEGALTDVISDKLGSRLNAKIEAKFKEIEDARLEQKLEKLETNLDSKLNILHSKLNSIDSSSNLYRPVEPLQKPQILNSENPQFYYQNPTTAPRANYNYSTSMYIDHSPPRIIATRTEEGAVFGLSSRQIVRNVAYPVRTAHNSGMNPIITPYTDSSKTQIYVPPPPKDFSHLSNLDDNGTIYSIPQKTVEGANPEHETYYAKPAKTAVNKLKPATDVRVSLRIHET